MMRHFWSRQAFVKIASCVALLVSAGGLVAAQTPGPPPADVEVCYFQPYESSGSVTLTPGSGSYIDLKLRSGHLIVKWTTTWKWLWIDHPEWSGGGRYRMSCTGSTNTDAWWNGTSFEGPVTDDLVMCSEEEHGPWQDPMSGYSPAWRRAITDRYYSPLPNASVYGDAFGFSLAAFGDVGSPMIREITEDWCNGTYTRSEEDVIGFYMGGAVTFPVSLLEAVDPLQKTASAPSLERLVTRNSAEQVGLCSSADPVTVKGLAAQLASQGRQVVGAVADDATRLLLRARVPGPGRVTFRLTGPLPDLSGPGNLTDVSGGQAGATLTTPAVAALSGYYAFALYKAPDGLPSPFSESMPFTISATVTDIQGGSSELPPLTLTLYQPPVLLLHGVLSDGSTWDKFPLWQDPRFRWIYPPSYPALASFADNGEEVRRDLQGTLDLARTQGVAACRADLIGHSMGGVLGRYWGRLSNEAYEGPRNWYRGDIRRLITLNSPHLGSRLANEVLAMSPEMKEALSRAVHTSVQEIEEGAARDLAVGSEALTTMGASAVPGHALAGSVNLSVDDTFWAVATMAFSPVLSSPWGSVFGILKPRAYNTNDLFLGPEHDFIVSVRSQRGNLATSAITPVFLGSPDFWRYWHCAVTSSADYATKCGWLLAEPGAVTRFAPFPVVPPRSIGPTAATLLGAAPAAAEPPTLEITSPPEGTLVTPGAEVAVTVQPLGAAVLASSLVLGPGWCAESSPADPSQVSFTVPAEAAGDYPLVAYGQLSDGQEAYSEVVRLRIDLTGCEPTVLRFVQKALNLEVGETSAAPCLLDCADGVTRSLAGGATGLTFLSTDETVATVDAAGNVTAVAPGGCSVLAFYQNLLASTEVTVRELPPVVDFSGQPTEGLAPVAVTFADLSTATPTGVAMAAWQWSFGDGESSTDQNPTHQYTRPGLYTVSLAASTSLGTGGKTRPRYVLVSFPDIPLDDWALDQILACVNAGIVGGYSDGTYRPGLPVDRASMAVFIARARAGGDAYVSPGPPTATFSDVPTSYWAFKYVEYAKSHGVVGGYSDGTYRPTLTVTRDQMAVFMARAMAGGDRSVPTGPSTATFPDVPTTYWAFKYVEYIKSEGVTGGYPDGTYRPTVGVTRDQMAVYVARAFGL